MRGLAVAVGLGLLLGCTAEPQPEDCADLCLELDPVVLGAILPLSGPLEPFGQAQRRGIERALEQVNADGGVDVGGEQRTVELELADDRGSADAAGQFAWSQVLGRAQVTALLGVCSPHRTVLSVAEAREVPLVAGCGPLASTAAPAPPAWLWERGPGQRARADAVLTALSADGGRRVAVFLSPGHPVEPWAQAAAARGLELVGSWTGQEVARRERVAADWTGPAAQARAGGADLVVAVTDSPDGTALWRALDAEGLLRPGRAYASEAGLSSAWRAQVGAAAEGTVTDAHGDLSAGVDEALAGVAADVTDVVLEALTRAGSDRRGDVNAALAETGARLSGSDAGGPAPRLALWRGDDLVPLDPG